ncbi:MAG: hypothetical protein ABI851_12335 [Saprospiraceae bacterium]
METLSPVQLNRLSRYLESPYFNKNEKLLKIYYAIEGHIRDPQANNIEKKHIWELIYPKETYFDEKFRKHCSQLMDLIESWLSQEEFEANPLIKAKYLLEAVHQRQLEKLYSGATNSALLNISRQALKPANYYLYIYEIESILYKLEKIEDQRVGKKNIAKINLESIVNNLDYFYIAEKLKYYTTLLSWSKIVELKDNILFIEDIIRIAQQEEFSKIPPIAIYTCIYFTYKDANNEEHYYNLKNLIRKHIHLFSKDESKNIMEAAMNYTITQINQRKDKYYTELFELHKSALEIEILVINDEISQWTFKNIVANALRLKEFEWVENFIQSYSNKLNPKIRNNAIIFNLATLQMIKKNYKEVLTLLQQVQYEELFYNLDSKAMLLRAYYELDETTALNSLIDSFNIYLTRNKDISKMQKSIYSGLIRSTKKLLNYQNKSKSDLQTFRKEVENSSPVGKQWLLEKIDEQIAIAKSAPIKKKSKIKV